MTSSAGAWKWKGCSCVLVLFLALSPFAQATVPELSTRHQILSALEQRAKSLQTLKASLEIGIPHPTASLVQWSDALIAFQTEPEFLYVKAYQPLIPLYFLLKSVDQKFWLFFPRQYKVYSGENALLEQDPDIDLKLIAGDVIDALTPVLVRDSENLVWARNKSGYQLAVQDADGKVRREVTFDHTFDVRRVADYNEAGFLTREVSENEWRSAGRLRFPFEIRIKRWVPRPNDLIIRFKEIRPNEALEPNILNYQFPADATYEELG